MLKLSQRQRNILDFIKKNAGVGNQAIKFHLEKGSGEKISRITVVRDVEELLRLKLIKKDGGQDLVVSGQDNEKESLEKNNIETPNNNTDIKAISSRKSGLQNSQSQL